MEPRLAASLPPELMLSVLLLLEVPDLIIAAAALPPQWRAVLESLPAVRRRILAFSNWQSCDNATSLAASQRFDWTISLGFDDGEQLYVSRRARDGAEGFLLLEEHRVRIAEPEAKWALAKDCQFWTEAELTLVGVDEGAGEICDLLTFALPGGTDELAVFVRFMRALYLEGNENQNLSG